MGFEKLIDLVVQFLEFFRFCTIIDHYERAVHLRFGRPYRVLEPGLWFQIPFFVDNVLNDNIKPRAKTLGLQSLLTTDDRPVSLGAIVTFSITDIQTALLEVEDMDTAVLDSCAGVIGNAVLNSTWAQVRSEDFPNKLAVACRRRAKEYGVLIERVQLMELTPARTLRLLQDNK